MNAADLVTRPVEPWFVVDRGDLPPIEPWNLYPGAILHMPASAVRIIAGYEPFPWVRGLLAVEEAPGRE